MAGRPRKPPNALAGHRAERPALVSIAGGRAGEGRAAKPGECLACSRALNGNASRFCSAACLATRVPPMPSPASGKRWLAATVQMWEEIWLSSAAEVWNQDRGLYKAALERWIRLQDQLIQHHRAVQKTPLVPGSKGQPRRNPAFDGIPRLEDMIRRLDDQLGMTPLSRVRMGLPVGGTKESRTPDVAADELDNAEAAWDWAAE